MNINRTKKQNQLQFHIHFLKPIDNKEDAAIVSLCSVAAYFEEKEKMELTIHNKDQLFYHDVLCGYIKVFDQDIDIIVDLEALKTCMKKVNDVIIGVGIQTFIKIYFHLYETGGFKDILEYYEKINVSI